MTLERLAFFLRLPKDEIIEPLRRLIETGRVELWTGEVESSQDKPNHPQSSEIISNHSKSSQIIPDQDRVTQNHDTKSRVEKSRVEYISSPTHHPLDRECASAHSLVADCATRDNCAIDIRTAPPPEKRSKPLTPQERLDRLLEQKNVREFCKSQGLTPEQYSSKLLSTAEQLLTLIVKTNPNRRFTFYQNERKKREWLVRSALALDGLIRLDGVTWDLLRRALKFIYETEYEEYRDYGTDKTFAWHKVIQSGAALRKHWDKIVCKLPEEEEDDGW